MKIVSAMTVDEKANFRWNFSKAKNLNAPIGVENSTIFHFKSDILKILFCLLVCLRSVWLWQMVQKDTRFLKMVIILSILSICIMVLWGCASAFFNLEWSGCDQWSPSWGVEGGKTRSSFNRKPKEECDNHTEYKSIQYFRSALSNINLWNM